MICSPLYLTPTLPIGSVDRVVARGERASD